MIRARIRIKQQFKYRRAITVCVCPDRTLYNINILSSIQLLFHQITVVTYSTAVHWYPCWFMDQRHMRMDTYCKADQSTKWLELALSTHHNDRSYRKEAVDPSFNLVAKVRAKTEQL